MALRSATRKENGQLLKDPVAETAVEKNMNVMDPQPPPPKGFFTQERIDAADRVLKGWGSFKRKSK